MPDSNTARRCIFCEGRANSREDAWPQWAVEWVGQDLPSRLRLQIGPDAADRELRDVAIKVKHVCRTCNNGWMSQLEGVSIPVLRPLMTDFAVPLDTMAQAVAAIWATKTAMVFEAITPKSNWFYTQDERTELMSRLAVPKNMLVWLGRNANSGSLFALSRRMSNPVPEAKTPFAKGYVVTLGMGRLVIHLLAIRSDVDHDVNKLTLEVNRGPWAKSLVKIWPTQYPQAKWPPPTSFSDTMTSLEELANRFARRP